MRYIYAFAFMIAFNMSFAQGIPEHISNTAVYDFLDELSLDGIIGLNTVVKPYTDTYIYKKLKEAKAKEVLLNKRQREELEFYLNEYAYCDYKKSTGFNIALLEKYNFELLPPRFRYVEKDFFMEIKPVWGIQYFWNDKGDNFHRWGGAAFKMKKGRYFSAWASLRDNNVTARFGERQYLNMYEGGNFKGGKGFYEYSEIRGGVALEWQWGRVSMVKDHVQWGTNYHGSNIFYSRAPSFAQLKLNLRPVKWFEFNYFHAWLVSDVIDSTRSYTTPEGNRRDVMHPKYLAANMFTFQPLDKIYFSFGNSIVYSDMTPNPAYLIPFLFYKSVDHWLNSTDHAGVGVGQNSQMFANISILRYKHFNFYGTLFFDEFKLRRIKEKGKYNPFSFKAGIKNSGGLMKNLSLTAEYTMTRPIVYQHYINTTTFESNSYNLGHYLRANSDEKYFAVAYKPVKNLFIQASYTKARHGNSYEYINGNEAITYPFMKEVKWTNEQLELYARYQFAFNSYVNVKYMYNNASGEELELYTHPYFQGKNHTISAGFNLGF